MKTILRSILFLSFLVISYSCAEVKKQIALDDLIGKYSGTVSVTIMWSQLNIGMEDKYSQGDSIEQVEIQKTADDVLVLRIDYGTIVQLDNLQMASNGAVFNIPLQDIQIISSNNRFPMRIQGLNGYTIGQNRCDGFYDRETGRLSFSYSGTVVLPLDGVDFNVPIEVVYDDFVKL